MAAFDFYLTTYPASTYIREDAISHLFAASVLTYTSKYFAYS